MSDNLTPKQEAFAQAIVVGCINASDAYRLAYQADAMSPKQIWVEASRLIKHPKVTLRVAELRDSVEPIIQEKLRLTKESAIDRFMEISQQAMDAKQFGASASSLMSACKVAGLIVDKVDAHLEVSEAKAKVTAADLYKKFQE